MAEGVEVASQDGRGSPTPVFAVDHDGRFTYVNEPAERLFGRRDRKLRGKPVWDEIAEPVRNSYRRTIERAIHEGQAAETQVRCPVQQRWFRVQAYPFEGGVSVHLEDLSERLERERELERREQALRDAYEITADREASLPERVDRLLAVVRATLGTDVGILSRRGEDGRFEVLSVAAASRAPVRAGQRVPEPRTRTCSEVVRTEQTLVMQDVGEQAPGLYEAAADIVSYIGSPVIVDEEAYGTFCFFSSDRRSEGFDTWETTYVDLFADWIGAAIEREGGWPAQEGTCSPS